MIAATHDTRAAMRLNYAAVRLNQAHRGHFDLTRNRPKSRPIRIGLPYRTPMSYNLTG